MKDVTLARGGAALVAGKPHPSPVARPRSISSRSYYRHAVAPHGPDGELLARCVAVLQAFDRFLRGSAPVARDEIGEIERLCCEVAAMRGTTARGLRAKAEVVRELLGPGLACYGAGRVSISLADDLLGRS